MVPMRASPERVDKISKPSSSEISRQAPRNTNASLNSNRGGATLFNPSCEDEEEEESSR